MSFRNTTVALILAAAAAPAAFADTGSTWVGGEAGFAEHSVAGQRTREQVRQEYLQFRDHPVLSDGTILLPGEAGYVTASEAPFADNKPSAPHSHAMGNVSFTYSQQPPMTEAEQRAYREQYTPF
jgi:hypothetical protein